MHAFNLETICMYFIWQRESLYNLNLLLQVLHPRKENPTTLPPECISKVKCLQACYNKLYSLVLYVQNAVGLWFIMSYCQGRSWIVPDDSIWFVLDGDLSHAFKHLFPRKNIPWMTHNVVTEFSGN